MSNTLAFADTGLHMVRRSRKEWRTAAIAVRKESACISSSHPRHLSVSQLGLFYSEQSQPALEEYPKKEKLNLKEGLPCPTCWSIGRIRKVTLQNLY